MQNGKDGTRAIDLALALEIDGDDLVRAPVGEPQPALVPARRLAERETGHQDVYVRHQGRVTAPSEAEETSRAYFASTPVS